jgi:hypothetical protein
VVTFPGCLRSPSSDLLVAYRLFLSKCTSFARRKQLLSVHATEKLDQFGDETGPAGLVTSPQASAVISMEVLVEHHVILPMGISLKFLRASVDRPPPRLVAQEDPGQPMGKLPGYLEEIHRVARTSRTLDLEVVAVIAVKR